MPGRYLGSAEALVHDVALEQYISNDIRSNYVVEKVVIVPFLLLSPMLGIKVATETFPRQTDCKWININLVCWKGMTTTPFPWDI